ncbi:exported hypothetical protein [Mesorhizobium sp. SOD10]|nr:exported hypothetical protein [Mesorhizobium sp. SOD10]
MSNPVGRMKFKRLTFRAAFRASFAVRQPATARVVGEGNASSRQSRLDFLFHLTKAACGGQFVDCPNRDVTSLRAPENIANHFENIEKLHIDSDVYFQEPFRRRFVHHPSLKPRFHDIARNFHPNHQIGPGRRFERSHDQPVVCGAIEHCKGPDRLHKALVEYDYIC